MSSPLDLLKGSGNLDLETYKPFMHEFQKMSGEIFDHDWYIFRPKVKDQYELQQEKLKRSFSNEYRLTETRIRQKEGSQADTSPERILKVLKKLPPFKGDELTKEQINEYQRKASIGWTFFAHQILHNHKVGSKIKAIVESQKARPASTNKQKKVITTKLHSYFQQKTQYKAKPAEDSFHLDPASLPRKPYDRSATMNRGRDSIRSFSKDFSKFRASKMHRLGNHSFKGQSTFKVGFRSSLSNSLTSSLSEDSPDSGRKAPKKKKFKQPEVLVFDNNNIVIHSDNTQVPEPQRAISSKNTPSNFRGQATLRSVTSTEDIPLAPPKRKKRRVKRTKSKPLHRAWKRKAMPSPNSGAENELICSSISQIAPVGLQKPKGPCQPLANSKSRRSSVAESGAESVPDLEEPLVSKPVEPKPSTMSMFLNEPTQSPKQSEVVTGSQYIDDQSKASSLTKREIRDYYNSMILKEKHKPKRAQPLFVRQTISQLEKDQRRRAALQSSHYCTQNSSLNQSRLSAEQRDQIGTTLSNDFQDFKGTELGSLQIVRNFSSNETNERTSLYSKPDASKEGLSSTKDPLPSLRDNFGVKSILKNKSRQMASAAYNQRIKLAPHASAAKVRESDSEYSLFKNPSKPTCLTKDRYSHNYGSVMALHPRVRLQSKTKREYRPTTIMSSIEGERASVGEFDIAAAFEKGFRIRRNKAVTCHSTVVGLSHDGL